MMSKFNIQMYLCCFEGLLLADEKKLQPSESLKKNVRTIEKMLGLNDSDGKLLEEKYASLLIKSLLQIIENRCLVSDIKDELISMRHFHLITSIISEATFYAITIYLPKDVLDLLSIQVQKIPVDPTISWLSNVSFLIKILHDESFKNYKKLEIERIQCLFAAFSEINEEIIGQCAIIYSDKQYLRYLLMLKSLKLQNSVALRLHQELLKILTNPKGFELLCQCLIDKNEPWKSAEVVAKICTAKGHSREFFNQISQQIVQLLRDSVLEKDKNYLQSACLSCLYSLHKNQLIQSALENTLVGWIDSLDRETLVGITVFDPTDYRKHLLATAACFGGNPMVTLPTKIISKHLVSIYMLLSLTPDTDKSSKEALITILHYILRNCDDLKANIRNIFALEETQIALNYSFGKVGPAIVIGEPKNVNDVLIQSVISTKNTLLMLKVLESLLEIYDLEKENSSSANLVEGEAELVLFVSKKFRLKLLVIDSLQKLIAYKPLHSALNENSSSILKVIEKLLEKQLAKDDVDIDNIQLLVSICCEILPNSETTVNFLSKYTAMPPNIIAFVRSLQGKSNGSKFDQALSLTSHSEPYIKANGIVELIKLINQKDPNTFANRYKILAVAIESLKDNESYIYLNTVRLLVALTLFIESDVIETLLSEFKNDQNDVEFRLKVAEVIFKVLETLGPLVVKYKKEIFDCFLYGCLNNKNELRASSFAKLGVACRLLSWQVHSFFHEIMNIIQQTLQFDEYKPAKRAAVLLVHQLLMGIDSIGDFQELLLPTYRVLKHVVDTEEDEVTITHCVQSLETLKNLVLKFLNPEQKLMFKLNIGDSQNSKSVEIKYK